MCVEWWWAQHQLGTLCGLITDISSHSVAEGSAFFLPSQNWKSYNRGHNKTAATAKNLASPRMRWCKINKNKYSLVLEKQHRSSSGVFRRYLCHIYHCIHSSCVKLKTFKIIDCDISTAELWNKQIQNVSCVTEANELHGRLNGISGF